MNQLTKEEKELMRNARNRLKRPYSTESGALLPWIGSHSSFRDLFNIIARQNNLKPVVVVLIIFLFTIATLQAKDNAFESLEFDLWMYQVCCIAPQFQYRIQDCNDESTREMFWNQYFLQGKSPVDAIMYEQQQGHDE